MGKFELPTRPTRGEVRSLLAADTLRRVEDSHLLPWEQWSLHGPRGRPLPSSADETLNLPEVQECIARAFISVKGNRVHNKLNREKDYAWTDPPKSGVRCATIADLIVKRDYPPNRMLTEVSVPRRVPGDFADVVVFRDDGQSVRDRQQAIEQAIGKAHSLRAEFALYDEGGESILFDTSSAYGSMERDQNRRGDRSRVPRQYSTEAQQYRFIADEEYDVLVEDEGDAE